MLVNVWRLSHDGDLIIRCGFFFFLLDPAYRYK